MPKCPWIPTHDVAPPPDGLDVGEIGTCMRCQLQYVVMQTNPYRLARDEAGAAPAIFALSMRRKLPQTEYARLLESPKVKKALRTRGVR
jgi:hypothetical protein